MIRFAGSRLTNLTVEAMAPDLATVTLQKPDANTAALSIAAVDGQILQGTQRLARLSFTAVTNQTSAFVPLELDSMHGAMAQAATRPTLMSTGGRIAIIGAQPLVDAHFSATGARELGLYGRRNATYIVQYSTNLANLTNWLQRGNAIAMGTNIFHTVPVGNIPNTNLPAVFRARTQ